MNTNEHASLRSPSLSIGYSGKTEFESFEEVSMPSRKPFHVPGSERTAPAGSQIIGEVNPKDLLTITVRVRRPAVSGKLRTQTLELSRLPPNERTYLTRTQFAAEPGADPTDLAKITAFAHHHGLTIVEFSRAKRSVKLQGTIEALVSAFQVELHRYKKSDRSYRGRVGSISVPEELSEIVVGVHGFDNQPVAEPHHRRRKHSKTKQKRQTKTPLPVASALST